MIHYGGEEEDAIVQPYFNRMTTLKGQILVAIFDILTYWRVGIAEVISLTRCRLSWGYLLIATKDFIFLILSGYGHFKLP